MNVPDCFRARMANSFVLSSRLLHAHLKLTIIYRVSPILTDAWERSTKGASVSQHVAAVL